MKRILTVLLFLLPFICNAQFPDKVKCIEIASEVCDTMILINKPDLDKINTAFYRLEVSDSLNIVNERLISNLILESNKLKELSESQRAIIENQKIQMDRINSSNKDVISDLEKQLKIANRKKTFWECTTGLGIVGIIFLAIF